MSQKRKNSGLAAFIIILIIALLCGAFGVYQTQLDGTPGNGNPDKQLVRENIFKNSVMYKKVGRPYIAAVYIEGTIEDENKTYNQDWLVSTIQDLQSDEKNRGILLYIDSPGGGVYQSDEVYLALCDYKKSGKTVEAYMGSLAASGGYYISCAADKIYANRNTLTGSIGVIAGTSIDLTGLMQKYGIKATTITAGKNKNMFNYNSPLTDEQRAIMQSVADDAYDQFTSIVALSRHLSVADVKKLADGRIYTAHQAVANGLVDHIGTWDDAAKDIAKKCGNPDMDIVTYRYERDESFFDKLLEGVSAVKGAAAENAGDVPEALLKKITPDIPYPAYIWRP